MGNEFEDKPQKMRESESLWIIAAFVFIGGLLAIFFFLGFQFFQGFRSGSQALFPVAVTPTIVVLSPEERSLLRRAAYAHVVAIENEDWTAYAQSMYPRGDVYNRKSKFMGLANSHDLKVSASEVSVDQYDGETGIVSLIITSEWVAGEPFCNNYITGYFIMKKHEGEWRIYEENFSDPVLFDPNCLNN